MRKVAYVPVQLPSTVIVSFLVRTVGATTCNDIVVCCHVHNYQVYHGLKIKVSIKWNDTSVCMINHVVWKVQ